MPTAELRNAAVPMRPPGWAGVGTYALDRNGDPRPWQPDHHVLLLVTAGHGPIEVDFRAHPCRPGTLLWIRPGQALRITRSGLDATVVTFGRELAIGDDPDGPGRWQLEGEDEDAIISEFTQLRVDCERLTEHRLAAELLRHELSVLLLRIALLTAHEASGAEARTFARFRRLLEDGHSHSRRVEDYAEELGCSVRTLTRACLAVTGRSAKQVVDDRVALQARRMLACTEMTIAEVGRHLGFPEPTNFGRFFHRETGASPGQFRLRAGAPEPMATIPAQRRSTD